MRICLVRAKYKLRKNKRKIIKETAEKYYANFELDKEYAAYFSSFKYIFMIFSALSFK